VFLSEARILRDGSQTHRARWKRALPGTACLRRGSDLSFKPAGRRAAWRL